MWREEGKDREKRMERRKREQGKRQVMGDML